MVYSRAERVFILEHYFGSKSFAAVREASSNAYLDKQEPNKTKVHRLVTKFRDTASVCDRKNVQRRRTLTGETLHKGEDTYIFVVHTRVVLMPSKLTDTVLIGAAF
jgi:hypothetical protein